MKTAIITGANGFIGAHVLYQLLLQDYTVHALGRSSQESAWPERVSGALREVGATETFGGRLFCHEFELCAAPLRIDFLNGLPAAETTLFHLAGDTRFRPSDPGAQRQLNVEAPVHLLNALRGRISTMIHVSTAYVAGKRAQLIREEELDCGQEFWNSYEKSKFDAELALTALCREQGLTLVIVRPSIIINDRKTGRASTNTHLNAMVEVVSRIQEHYGILDGQVVSKAIRLMADPQARPNLAPVDSIVPPLLKIAQSAAAAGRVFHLCHPRPQTNDEVMSLICEAFQVKGRVALEFLPSIPKPMSHTEEMIARSLKDYAPYLNNRCEFDLTHSRSVVWDYDSYFTPLDAAYLRKVIQFERQNRN
jgi:nucleoside-diphosphate-sugar epimerase